MYVRGLLGFGQRDAGRVLLTAMRRIELRLAALRLIDENAFSNPLWGAPRQTIQLICRNGS